MDGNGRWAEQRGLPRLAGHRRGADAIRRTVEAAPGLWHRHADALRFLLRQLEAPAEEVGGLMQLFARYLESEVNELMRKGVRLQRDRPARPPGAARWLRLIERDERAHRARLEAAPALAVDYSSREHDSARRRSRRSCRGSATASPGRLGPDVDLLIRTGGEQRLSDFLLVGMRLCGVTAILVGYSWPDFSEQADLAGRHRLVSLPGIRRFGALVAKPA